MTEIIAHRIGFIPAVVREEDALVVTQEAVQLFQSDVINEICVTSKFCLSQRLKAAGIPADKITVLNCVNEDTQVKLFVRNLKRLPKQILGVRIIAMHYACQRLQAQLIREERKREREIVGLLTCFSRVYPGRRDWQYWLNCLCEPLRIIKDAAASVNM